MSEIMAIRSACLPPRNSASKYAFTMSFANSTPTIRSPNARIFALLCCFTSLAVAVSEQTAARLTKEYFAQK